MFSDLWTIAVPSSSSSALPILSQTHTAESHLVTLSPQIILMLHPTSTHGISGH